MNGHLAARLPADFLAFLVSPAVRSLLLAAAAGLAMLALRIRPAGARLATWKFVLYAALAMPLLAAFMPAIPFAVPVPGFFRATGAAPWAVPAAGAGAAAKNAPADVAILQMPQAAATAASAASQRPRPRRRAWWALAAVALYGMVALLFLLRLALGWLVARRLRRVARTIPASEAPSELGAAARAAGLADPPLVAETDLISVPATLGVLRPVILLPADWRDWEAAKLRAVLAHEASHIARGDPLTRALALLHRALFWFSPLAWRLDRKLAELAEEASDEAALGAGADRAGYAEALLGFFAAAEAAPGRVRWQEIAMASPEGNGRQAERRLERILTWKGERNMKSQRSTITLAVALAAPLALLAATAQPRLASAKSAPAAMATAAPAAASFARAAAQPRPQAQPAAAPEARHAFRGRSYAFAPQDDGSAAALAPYDLMAVVAGEQCAVLSRWNTSLGSCASSQLPSAAVSLRNNIHGDFIWFERDGKGYVITDPATVQQAAALFQPIRELGRQQSSLGAAQSKFGEEQSRLGQQQSRLGASQAATRVKAGSVPDYSAQLEKVAAQLKALAARGASQDELADVQAELGNLQGEIGALQGRASEQQSALGAQQAALAEQQAKLGEKQAELGERQAALGRKQAAAMQAAERQLKTLLDSASRNGLAKAQ